jgi:hypothetical protein
MEELRIYNKWFHLLVLKTIASNADNPNWWEAIKSPFNNKYWKAAVKEIKTPEKVGVPKEVTHNHPEGANVVDPTWVFKIKYYLDVLIKKVKACFFLHGDQQVHSVDFFEMYTPFVQCITIQLMLILEVILNLKPKQVNIMAAFDHNDVQEDKNI